MKTAKAKKQVLDARLLEDEFFADVTLIGIVSAYEYYRLVSFITQRLPFPFTRNHHFEILLNDTCYPVFYYEDRDKMTEHFLFCNRRRTTFMMPEARNVDYIWMIKGCHSGQQLSGLIRDALKKVEGVDFCFGFEAASLKNRQLLII